MAAEDVLKWWDALQNLLPMVVVGLACAVVAIVLATLILNLLDMRRHLKQKVVFLELTPPAHTDRSADANIQLLNVLHGLEGSRSFLDKILRRKVTFSLEITSTREQGIRYLWRVPEAGVLVFKQAVASHLPEARFEIAKDALAAKLDWRTARVLVFRQAGRSFAYPLQTQSDLERHDPIAYLNGAMTQLEPGELIIFQAVVSPTKVHEAEIMQHRLAHNEELVTRLGRRRPAGRVTDIINGLLFGILDAVGEIVTPSRGYKGYADDRRRREVAAKLKPARMMSQIEADLATKVHAKLQQPLFRVDVRALVVMQDKKQRSQRVASIKGALDAFKLAKYQSLKARFGFPPFLAARYRLLLLKNRLPTLFRRNSCIFSASELAGIYHFPNSRTAKTENVVKSLSKTLAAPLALKSGIKPDVVLGHNDHHGNTTEIGLTDVERERHMFVVGGTGNGKTTLLKYAIIQDIKNGRGVAVVDPHGDLAQEILEYIPEERINDVIYFNPADLGYPIGLNLLEVPEGLSGDQLLDAKEFIAETVVSIMRKTFSDDGTGGHRIEYVLRNAVLTALTVENATIFTIYDLLTDRNFRKPIVEKLEQPWLKNFWKNEYSKAGDYQQVKMMGGVTAKIGRYHASVSAERILEQPKSTIDFDEILDGKILICNLPKGIIGEDTSEVLGVSILAKLQLAAFRRIKQKRTERRPFFAYVDEFQNFATVSFAEMLSEARKYKLFLTMAEQTTSQQDDQRLVDTLLTNAGTIVAFKTSSPSDERQLLPLFAPSVQPGELFNLPTYNFYIRLAGTVPQEPTSGVTIVPEPGNPEMTDKVIAASRANYAKKYEPKKPAKSRKPEAAKIDQAKNDDDELPENSALEPERI